MAAIAFVVLIVLSLAGMVLLTARAQNRSALAPAWLGWIGAMLVLGAFMILPWAVTGPSGVFTRNASWLVDQAAYLELLRQVPVVQEKVAALQLDTVDDIRLLLARPETSQFLAQVEQGGSFSAWQLLQMARPVSLWLPIALVAGLLAAFLALVASLVAQASASRAGAMLGAGAGVVAVIGLALLLGKLPFIDTLGVTDNFVVRLIAVLGEVRVAAGGWWMAAGLLLVVCASVLYRLFGRAPVPERDDETWNMATGWSD